MTSDAVEDSLRCIDSELSTQLSYPFAEAEGVFDRAPSSLSWQLPERSQETDNCIMGGYVPGDVDALSVTAFYQPQYMAGCTCVESTNLRIALHHLQGATRATAAILAQIHSDDIVHQHCDLLQEIIRFDGILS